MLRDELITKVRAAVAAVRALPLVDIDARITLTLAAEAVEALADEQAAPLWLQFHDDGNRVMTSATIAIDHVTVSLYGHRDATDEERRGRSFLGGGRFTREQMVKLARAAAVLDGAQP